MNKKQQAKEKTSDKLTALKVRFTTELTPYKQLMKDFTDQENCMTNIRSKFAFQSTDNTGIAEDSSTKRDAFIYSILLNAGPASSYFFEIDDMTNFHKTYLKEYMLKRAKPADLNAIAEIVKKVCTDNLLPLANSDVDATSIALISTTQTAYNTKSNLSTATKTEQGVNTKEIGTLYTKLGNIINIRLKSSAIVIRELYPEIYNLIIATTHDIQIGIHSHHDPLLVYGNVTLDINDINTGESVYGASAKAVGYSLVGHTDESGLLELKLPVGTHIIKIISFDYQPFEITVIVTETDQTIPIQLSPVVVA